MLTHTLTTEYTAIFSIIFLLINCKKLKNKNVLKKLVINVIFILTISAFFLIPLLEYKTYGDYTIFSALSMRYRGEDVAQTAINPIQLIKDTDFKGVSFKLGITFIILMLLGIFTYRKMENQYKETYITFLIIAILSLFMTTKFFPWKIMPDAISTMQFAWRMLAFFEFSMAMLCAFNLFTLIDIISKNVEWVKGLAIIISIIIVIITMQKTDYDYRYEESKNMKDYAYEAWIYSEDLLSPYSINREYLPIKALDNLDKSLISRERKVYILSGNANIYDEILNDLNLSFKFKNTEDGTVLELPFLYYPGYTVTIKSNGSEKNVKYTESDCGLLSIKLSEILEEAEVEVEYTGTAIEKISYVISALAIIAFIIYVKKEKE